MKDIKRTQVVVLLLVCFLCFAYPNAAKAGPVTDSATFVAGLAPGYFLNQFTGLTGLLVDNPMSFSGGTGNAFSYDAAATNGLYGLPATGSTSWLSTNVFGDTLNITFTSGNVTAVGGNFFNTDITGTELTDSVTVLLSGVSGSVTLPASGDTPVDFWGYLSTPGVFITGLTITPPAGTTTDGATVANLYVGAVRHDDDRGTPEPATFGLLGAGLLAAGLLGKRLSRV